ncbi:hypothetical protein MTO96_025849 [Rhipicephalus appendiculatus]
MRRNSTSSKKLFDEYFIKNRYLECEGAHFHKRQPMPATSDDHFVKALHVLADMRDSLSTARDRFVEDTNKCIQPLPVEGVPPTASGVIASGSYAAGSENGGAARTDQERVIAAVEEIRASTDTAFYNLLLCSCRNWLNLHASDKGRLVITDEVEPAQEVAHVGTWEAYLLFLASLVTVLAEEDAAGRLGSRRTHQTTRRIFLRVVFVPIELLRSGLVLGVRSALMLAGKSVEEATPNIMESLVSSLRDALLTPGISEELQAMLRELLEFQDAGFTYASEQHGG